MLTQGLHKPAPPLLKALSIQVSRSVKPYCNEVADAIAGVTQTQKQLRGIVEACVAEKMQQLDNRSTDMGSMLRGKLPVLLGRAIAEKVKITAKDVISFENREKMNGLIRGTRCPEEDIIRSLDQKLQRQDKRISNQDKSLDEVSRLQETVEKQQATIDKLLTAMGTLTAANNTNQQHLSQLRATINSQAVQLADFPRILTCISEFEARLKMFADLPVKSNDPTSIAPETDTRLRMLESKAKFAEDTIQQHMSQMPQMQGKIDDQATQLAGFSRVRADISTCEAQLRALTASTGKASVTTSITPQVGEKMQKLEAELESTKASIKALVSADVDFGTKIDQIQNERKMAVTISTEPDTVSRVQSLERQLESVKTDIGTLSSADLALDRKITQIANDPKEAINTNITPAVSTEPEVYHRIEMLEQRLEAADKVFDTWASERQQFEGDVNRRCTELEQAPMTGRATSISIDQIKKIEHDLFVLARVPNQIDILENRIKQNEAAHSSTTHSFNHKFRQSKYETDDLGSRMSNCEDGLTELRMKIHAVTDDIEIVKGKSAQAVEDLQQQVSSHEDELKQMHQASKKLDGPVEDKVVAINDEVIAINEALNEIDGRLKVCEHYTYQAPAPEAAATSEAWEDPEFWRRLEQQTSQYDLPPPMEEAFEEQTPQYGSMDLNNPLPMEEAFGEQAPWYDDILDPNNPPLMDEAFDETLLAGDERSE